MKKIFKNSIFTFILGLIFATTITAVALNLTASTASFTPEDEDWDVGTVEEALNSLYSSKNELNFSINVFRDARSASIYPHQFTNYKHYMITGVSCYNGATSTIQGTNNYTTFTDLSINTQYNVTDFEEIFFISSKAYCNYQLKFY